jgi:hypothetical protein
MALRERPAERPCSAPWQYLRGHSVVPGDDEIGGVFSWDICESGATDSIPNILRPGNCYNKFSGGNQRLDEFRVGFADLLASYASGVVFQVKN